MYPLIRRYLRRVDVVYLLLCAACSAISVVVLLSIGQTQLGSNNKASVQLIASLLGLMLAFSERVNIVLAMFLCHWALIGLSKVYFFGIPEDYLLACSIVPALYLFFREYIRDNAGRPTKPSPRVLNALLAVMCLIIGCFFAFTLLHQLNLFTDC